MKRLIEMRGARDPRIKAAANAISQVSPTEPSSVSKARVWARLQKGSSGIWRVPVRFLAGAFVLVATAALASGKVSWRHPLGLFSTQSSPSTLVPSAVLSAIAPLPFQFPAISPENDAGAVDADRSDATNTDAPTLTITSSRLIPRTTEAIHAPPGDAVALAPTSASYTQSTAAPTQTDDESGLVLLGLAELRREHNPLKARQIFANYLSRHPNGALAEDALGYSLEAADSTGSPEAKLLADAYLRSYPRGRYRDLATRIKNAREP